MSGEDVRRQDALVKIIQLMSANNITVANIEAAIENPPRQSLTEERSGVLASVLGYLGGIFLFAGIAAFIGLNWDEFPPFARVMVTLGLGLAVFFAAMMIERDTRWGGAATPAYLVAMALQPTGLLVTFDEYGHLGDWHIAILISSAILTSQAIAAWFLNRNAVLVFTALLFGTSFFVTLFDFTGIPPTPATLTIGLSLVLVGAGLPAYPWNRLVWATLGSATFYWSWFDLLLDEPLEMIFLFTAALGVWLSVQFQLRALMATSTLAALAYLGYFTAEHFADSLGWPLVLMLIGAMFVGLGYVALRINRTYFSRAAGEG